MNHKTAYNHLTRLKSRMNSIYSGAEGYCSPHSSILEHLSKLYLDPAIAKCPAWVRQALGDYSGFRLERIQRDLVVWMFKTESGSIKSWDALTDAEKKFCSDNNTGDHFWLKRDIQKDNWGKFKGMAGDTITRDFKVTDKAF